MIARMANVRKLDLREYWKREGAKAYEEFKDCRRFISDPSCLYQGGLFGESDNEYLEAFLFGYNGAKQQDDEQAVLETASGAYLERML